MHGNEMSTRPWEKLLHISGNLEGHSHMQGCTHAQGRPEKALITHSTLLCANWKAEC